MTAPLLPQEPATLLDRMAKVLVALFTNPHQCLEDRVYDVREREGLGWEGPSVKAWGEAASEGRKLVDALQSGEALGTCTWTGSEDCWESSCGVAWTFPEGGPKDNGMRFCHCCGRALVEIPDGTDEE